MAVTVVDTDEVVRLVAEGAQLLDVLPAAEYREEHLPGAVNIALPELTREAAGRLDRARPVVTYCYDLQCDLSSRAAALLEAYGHPDVYDYGASKVAWFSCGLPAEGTIPVAERAGAIARPAATCEPDTPLADLPEPGPGGVVLVVDADQVVLGAVAPNGLRASEATTPVLDVVAPGPTSVRPSIRATELARSMDRSGEPHVVVSKLDGTLIGIVERADLDRVDR